MHSVGKPNNLILSLGSSLRGRTKILLKSGASPGEGQIC